MTQQQEYQAYPRMLYQKGGGYSIASSEEEEEALIQSGGWSRDPSPEAFSQLSTHHTTRVPVDDPSSRAKEQQQQARQEGAPSLDYIVEEVIRRLQARDLLRRPPGRPPGGSRNPADEE